MWFKCSIHLNFLTRKSISNSRHCPIEIRDGNINEQADSGMTAAQDHVDA